MLDELRAQGVLSFETRRELAAEAFATTAAYEAAIATWFSEREAFPETLVVALEKVVDLSYGENPHQRAAYYAERGARTHLLSRVEQLHGKALSFNNLNDLSAGRMLVREFTLPACVIVKHANPCGVAIGATLEEAYDKALASDPTSAYGGDRRREPRGRRRARREARRAVRRGALRARLRRRRARGARAQAEHAHPRRPRAPPTTSTRAHYKRVLGGMLVQDSRRRHRGPRELAGRLRRAGRARSGAISSSRGASASTSRRTRSSS